VLRKIYYSLPVSLRYYARRLYYLPHDLISKRDKRYPQLGLIFTGHYQFEKQGIEWVGLFKKYGLTNTANFLDIGCGIGRIAIPLSFDFQGNYFGFDAVKRGVDWCKKNISSNNKNFHFLYVDLFNDLYKTSGSNAANYQFEYENDFFDFACAISVYTHMIPIELVNYLKNSASVIKSNGIKVATFFILDEESRVLQEKNSSFSFKHTFENFALMDENVAGANVAYDKGYLEKVIKDSGFEIIEHIKGSWCGRKKEHFLDFQDILIMRRK
jgi:SAM-dependent methyltransferase